MAHNLGLTVIAEGAETYAQAAFLSSKDCEEVQGFLYGRPTRKPSPKRSLRAAKRSRNAAPDIGNQTWRDSEIIEGSERPSQFAALFISMLISPYGGDCCKSLKTGLRQIFAPES
jgi:hypothetical protein